MSSGTKEQKRKWKTGELGEGGGMRGDARATFATGCHLAEADQR